MVARAELVRILKSKKRWPWAGRGTPVGQFRAGPKAPRVEILEAGWAHFFGAAPKRPGEKRPLFSRGGVQTELGTQGFPEAKFSLRPQKPGEFGPPKKRTLGRHTPGDYPSKGSSSRRGKTGKTPRGIMEIFSARRNLEEAPYYYSTPRGERGGKPPGPRVCGRPGAGIILHRAALVGSKQRGGGPPKISPERWALWGEETHSKSWRRALFWENAFLGPKEKSSFVGAEEAQIGWYKNTPRGGF